LLGFKPPGQFERISLVHVLLLAPAPQSFVDSTMSFGAYGGYGGGFGGGSYGGGGGGFGGGGGQFGGGQGRDLDSIQLRKEDFRGLPPFEKNFYHEHPAVTARSDVEIASYRDKREIHIQGHDVPKPVTTFEEASFPGKFDQAGLHTCFQRQILSTQVGLCAEYVLAEVNKAGFTEPTPIQCQGWPMALMGRDLIGLAETGSGKTLAYLLPAVVHINAQPYLGMSHGQHCMLTLLMDLSVYCMISTLRILTGTPEIWSHF